MGTPRDVAFSNSIMSLRTRRDARVIAASHLMSNGGIQFSGFSSLKFRRLQSVLSQFDKCGSIAPSAGNSGTVVLRCFDRKNTDENVIKDIDSVLPEHGLLPNTELDFKHSSVARRAFSYADRGQGVSTAVLRSLVALPMVLDVEVAHRVVHVYTVTPNKLASSLYNTIKCWKEEPCSSNLSVRSFRKLPLARKKHRRRRRRNAVA